MDFLIYVFGGPYLSFYRCSSNSNSFLFSHDFFGTTSMLISMWIGLFMILLYHGLLICQHIFWNFFLFLHFFLLFVLLSYFLCFYHIFTVIFCKVNLIEYYHIQRTGVIIMSHKTAAFAAMAKSIITNLGKRNMEGYYFEKGAAFPSILISSPFNVMALLLIR